MLKNTTLSGQGWIERPLYKRKKAQIRRQKFNRMRAAAKWCSLGVDCYEQGKTREAIHCLKLSLSFHYKSPLTHCILGVIYSEQDRVNASINHCSRAIEYQCSHALPFIFLALGLKRRGENAEALNVVHFALEHFPEEDGLFYLLCEEYNKPGSYEKALYNLQKAITINPNMSLYWEVCSKICLELIFENQALEMTVGKQIIIAVDNWILLDPENAEAYFIKGALLYEKELYASSALNFEQSLRIDPLSEVCKSCFRDALEAQAASIDSPQAAALYH